MCALNNDFSNGHPRRFTPTLGKSLLLEILPLPIAWRSQIEGWTTFYFCLGPLWLVLKYAENGCFLDYVKQNRYVVDYENVQNQVPIYQNVPKKTKVEPLTEKEKFKFAYEIAKGMLHLESKRVRWWTFKLKISTTVHLPRCLPGLVCNVWCQNRRHTLWNEYCWRRWTKSSPKGILVEFLF